MTICADFAIPDEGVLGRQGDLKDRPSGGYVIAWAEMMAELLISRSQENEGLL